MMKRMRRFPTRPAVTRVKKKKKELQAETQERKGLVSEICFDDGGEGQTDEEKTFVS